jgi:hypothetical protein
MREGLLAELDGADAMVRALGDLRARGYRRLDYHSPIAVPEAERLLGGRERWVARLAVGAALGGGIAAYFVQWYANAVDYPLNVGGRPLHAVPAFLAPAFETAGLAATAAVAGALAWVLGLPRLWQPVFDVDGFERATSDRFWVGIDASDPRFDWDGSARALEELGPLRVVRLGGGS